jgi:hypothetical protein
MRRLLVFAVVLLATSARAEDWSKRFPVSGKPELRVEADDAAVIVRAGASNAIEARVTTRGWRIGADGVRITERQTGNRVEIGVRVPEGGWGSGNRSVRLELSVPAELKAEIRTGDGHVSAQGLKGDLRIVTGDGAIEAEGLDGSLEARTGDGSLSVRGRFDALDLRTDDGSVTASVNPGSKMAGPWRVHTDDGSVTLRLPDGFAADIDAHTGDGSINVSLPVTTSGFQSSKGLRGKLNGGGPTLHIETGDGAIRVERL